MLAVEPVQNPVDSIKKPGDDAQDQRGGWREVQAHRLGEGPAPDDRNGGSIQAKEMPPFCNVVATSGQVPV